VALPPFDPAPVNERLLAYFEPLSIEESPSTVFERLTCPDSNSGTCFLPPWLVSGRTFLLILQINGPVQIPRTYWIESATWGPAREHVVHVVAASRDAALG